MSGDLSCSSQVTRRTTAAGARESFSMVGSLNGSSFLSSAAIVAWGSVVVVGTAHVFVRQDRPSRALRLRERLPSRLC